MYTYERVDGGYSMDVSALNVCECTIISLKPQQAHSHTSNGGNCLNDVRTHNICYD